LLDLVEGIMQDMGKFQLLEVVAICDYLILFRFSQLKHEGVL
jgi:hypothetical protein